jgi:hypothetical protein
MCKLFSYVVAVDKGFAPNPSGGYCTLANCMCRGKGGRRNVVELAEIGDWIVGTGGADKKKSSGHGTLIYTMRVEQKLTLYDYYRDSRFRGRLGNCPDKSHRKDTYALISSYFWYFGREAIGIPKKYLEHPLEKRGRGFRSNFSEGFIRDFIQWLEGNYKRGVHGGPCWNEGKNCTRTRTKARGKC